jgi:O-antigen/teichoic acid export membrane protein
MVYASGSVEKMRTLLGKAFKVTTALSVFPLGFIAVFGTTIALAWTGETAPSLQGAFLLVCLSALFRAYSLLSFVLYRVSGRAILDNLRQVLRILVLSSIVVFASRLGFEGVLAGLALAEFSGMAFMLFALARTFKGFRVQSLLPDAIRILTAAVFILGAGILAYYIPFPDRYGLRAASALKLLQVSVACLLVAWPILVRTGSVSAAEGRALLGAFLNRRSSSTLA